MIEIILAVVVLAVAAVNHDALRRAEQVRLIRERWYDLADRMAPSLERLGAALAEVGQSAEEAARTMRLVFERLAAAHKAQHQEQ